MTERTHDDFLDRAAGQLKPAELAAISTLLLAYKRQLDLAIEVGDAIGDGWLRVNDARKIAALDAKRSEQKLDQLDMSNPRAVAKATKNWAGKQKEKARQLRGVSLDDADTDADADDAAAAHAVVVEIASTATPEQIELARESLIARAQEGLRPRPRGGRPKGDLNRKKLQALLVLLGGHGGAV